jgi:hypothetical protein
MFDLTENTGNSYVQELRNDGGRCHLDEHDVVESDSVERVEKRKTTLDLMRLDHGRQDIVHGERFAFAREVIRYGKDRAQIVRWMSPYRKRAMSIQING